MATIYHQVWIHAPVEKVYDAVSSAEGLSQWWAPHTTEEVNGALVFSHDPGPEHGQVKMQVVKLGSKERVELLVVSQHPEISPASAWTGTNIVFAISEKKNPGRFLGMDETNPTMAVLDFRHSGWDEEHPFFGFCNFAWGATLLALKQWCEAGPARS